MIKNLQRVAITEQTQSLLDQQCQQLWDKFPNLVDVESNIKFHQGFGDYEVTLKATLPLQTICAVRNDRQLDEALSDVFAALHHKLTKYQDKQRAKRFWVGKLKVALGRLLPTRQSGSIKS
ncbi:hypothetical protein JCM19240_4784 [Vibrio maritimus]|uniref:Ribosomal subunit interface protein n=1 Tax=Vibrio maritimus TaxID=990268 RepID=A0A090TAS4_9VIBR|nr:hypothetical protein JCM19240_4784 [Vibrio maritimus]